MEKKRPDVFSVSDYVALFCAVVLIVGLILGIYGKVQYWVTAAVFLFFLCVWIIWGFFMQNTKDALVTFVIFSIVFLTLSFSVTEKGIRVENDRSRMGTIGSIFVHNTFAETQYNIGSDKMIINGTSYSSKPPMLSFLGAGVLGVMAKVRDYYGKPTDPNGTYEYYWLVLFLIALPSALAAVVFYKLLKYAEIHEFYRYVLVFAFIFGTLMFSFSSVLNNHTVAAACVLAGFYFFFCARFDQSWRSAVASGFFFSLATTIEPQSGVWFVLFPGLFLIRRKYKLCLLYALGALLPLIFHFPLQYQITGNMLPAQFQSNEVLIWEGSPWPEVFVRISKYTWWEKVWDTTFGAWGLFTYTPIFLFSFWGLFAELKRRKNKFWWEALVTLLGIVFFIFYYYSHLVKDYGGPGWGFRWYIHFIPLLFFFTANLFVGRDRLTWGNAIFLVVFLLIVAYSVYVAHLGTIYAWEFGNRPVPAYLDFRWEAQYYSK